MNILAVPGAPLGVQRFPATVSTSPAEILPSLNVAACQEVGACPPEPCAEMFGLDGECRLEGLQGFFEAALSGEVIAQRH